MRREKAFPMDQSDVAASKDAMKADIDRLLADLIPMPPKFIGKVA